jgi:hypothetical protein
VAELRGRLGGVELDAVELPFDQPERGSIERIDPRSRQPILRAEVAPVSLLRP